MKRLLFLCLFLLGCGPAVSILPPHLEPDQQKSVDDAWTSALRPVERHTRQQWLDCLVVTQAYQVGVDKFTFRSEKATQDGLVVMEIQYDRMKPNDDRFTITVLDQAGQQVRQERYSREEVLATTKDLLGKAAGQPGGNPPPASPEARLKHVEEMLPKAIQKDEQKQ